MRKIRLIRPIRPIRLILFLLLAVVLFGTSFYFFTKPAVAAWFDDNWGYRKAISIPTHTAAENNVYVTVPTFDATDTTKFQADCGDLRFTKQNGELLPYYVVDCDATADVHVQFDTLPAGASTYYMYYGNPSAQNGFESADFSTAASGLGTQTLASEEKGPGPVAYWGLDEGYGTTTQDKTANNNDGAISGATWQSEDMCVSGKCLSFDGTNDVVTVSNTVSGIQSVSFWVKPITTSEQFIDLNGSAYIQVSSGTISATGFTSPIYYVNGRATTSPTLTANSWQYITVTTGTAISGSAIKIGQISTNYGQAFFDEVKIYNYARSADQIKADYASRGSTKGATALLGGDRMGSSEVGGLSQGLVGYWKMDESSWTVDCSTTSVTDSSGNANHGAACPATTGPDGGDAGKFGNGGDFDGSNDYVQIAHNSIFNITNNFTIEAWINQRSSGWAPSIIYKGGYSPQGWVILVNGDATSYNFGLAGWKDGSWWSGVYTGGLKYNQWYHVVVTYNGSRIQNYLDGKTTNGANITGNFATNTEPIKIGVPYTSLYYNGFIDDVRIYNRALSPAEVSQLYNWAPGPKSNLNMDEGSGTQANDSSGNNNYGTLNDDPTWSTGKYGKGVKLDGTNDDVSVGDFGY